jgi:hypothetical protein
VVVVAIEVIMVKLVVVMMMMMVIQACTYFTVHTCLNRSKTQLSRLSSNAVRRIV